MPKTPEIENKFRRELEVEYEKTKAKLSNLLATNASPSTIKAEKNGLFIISAGLFAYGRLDVAEDVLDCIPGGRGSINDLARVLIRLLPLPRLPRNSNLSYRSYLPFNNPDIIREWLKAKYSRLGWDECLERYVLENFRVLVNLPPKSDCKQFQVQVEEKQQEKLFLEILPDDGKNWYACFQAGKTNFSGVYQHPNHVDLIIISSGQGYIINPESQQLLETFGGEITDTIEFFDDYAILFRDI
ncbi:MAG: hypothetical protein SAL07_10110 [Oscillatoria sp. PMC 1051.18]|nr:hypothetical protein [Oscillatoria sp. PMC 1050.18]MEC5030257.1 hypothetical protein [Oscillatoria sp. PMC 1051.18]